MNLRLRPFSTSLTLSLLLAANTVAAAAPFNRVRVPTGTPKNASLPSLALSPSTLGLNALAGTYVEATASLVNSGSVGVVIKGVDLEYLGTGVTLDENCANKWLGPKESCKVRVGLNATQAGNSFAGTVAARYATGAANLVIETRTDANPATAKIHSLSASPESIVANGLSRTTLRAEVVDAYGNPIGAGSAVQWGASKGGLSVTSSVTDEAGLASVILTSDTTLGMATVQAKSAGSGQGSSAQVKFIADSVTAKVASLELSAASIVSGGTVDITTKLQDASGHPVANAPISLATASGAVSEPPLTDSAGYSRAVWMPSGIAGSYSISARGAAADSGMSKSVLVTANPTQAKVVSVTSSSGTVVAGGVATITAKLQDASGNAISGGAITWTPSSGSVSNATSSGATGLATATWTLASSLGAHTIKARGITGDPGASATVSVTTPPVVASLSSSLASIPAGNSTVVTAKLQDSGGSVVANAPVIWASTSGTITNVTVSNSSGLATATWTPSGVVGSYSITAKGSSADTGVAKSIPVVANIATARAVYYQGEMVVKANSNFVLYARVFDSFNNPIPNTNVTWTAPGNISFTSTGIGKGGVLVVASGVTNYAGTFPVYGSVIGSTLGASVITTMTVYDASEPVPAPGAQPSTTRYVEQSANGVYAWMWDGSLIYRGDNAEDSVTLGRTTIRRNGVFMTYLPCLSPILSGQAWCHSQTITQD